MGVHARPWVRQTAPHKFHAVVRWPDGRIEDPSRVLRGLEDPMSSILGADSIVRWRVRRIGPGAYDGEVTLPIDLETALRAIARPPTRSGQPPAPRAVPRSGARSSGAQQAASRAPTSPTLVDSRGRATRTTGGTTQPVPSGGGTVTTRRRGRSWGGALKRALGTALRAAGSINPIAGAASSLFGGLLRGEQDVLGAADAVYPPQVARQLRRLAVELARKG